MRRQLRRRKEQLENGEDEDLDASKKTGRNDPY
jgi:hypothetical protein